MVNLPTFERGHWFAYRVATRMISAGLRGKGVRVSRQNEGKRETRKDGDSAVVRACCLAKVETHPERHRKEEERASWRLSIFWFRGWKLR
jgi:hypothetical protein